MSRNAKGLDFCLCKNKDTGQLCSASCDCTGQFVSNLVRNCKVWFYLIVAQIVYAKIRGIRVYVKFYKTFKLSTCMSLFFCSGLMKHREK